jgi:heptose-I-phosphate ethanolaminephosphotransferase
MQSLQLQSKPAFSWKALGWALLYFWFFLITAGRYLF